MTETVLSFHGGKFWVDEGTPVAREFYIGFEGQLATYAGKEIDLRYSGNFNLTREKGQSTFVEIPLVADSNVYLSFDCQFQLIRKGKDSLEVHIDGGPSCVLKLDVDGVEVEGQFHSLSEYGDSFHYRRTSGESPRVATIKRTGEVLRVPFSRTLKMGYIPVVSDPETADIMKHLRPPSATTEDRIQAWNYQRFGWIAVHKDKTDWEPVELTDEERRIVEANQKRKRQHEFDEKCGC